MKTKIIAIATILCLGTTATIIGCSNSATGVDPLVKYQGTWAECDTNWALRSPVWLELIIGSGGSGGSNPAHANPYALVSSTAWDSISFSTWRTNGGQYKWQNSNDYFWSIIGDTLSFKSEGVVSPFFSSQPDSMRFNVVLRHDSLFGICQYYPDSLWGYHRATYSVAFYNVYGH